jgi:methionyl-tRNA formyltransferase
MHDDSQTGISLMYMDKTLDTGDIIYQQAISIAQNETYRSLYERLCELVYRVIYDRVDILFSVNLTVQRQDESKVTYAKNIRRLDELIQ